MVRIVEGFAARLDVPPDTCRKSGVQVFDDVLRGFGVRKYPDGRAYFFVKYSVGGKQGRHTLGSALERGGLKDARKEATRMLLYARAGRDPLAAKKAAKAEHAALVNRKTLGTLVSDYLTARKAKLRPRTFSEVDRYLRKAWKPLHDRDIKSITRADVMGVLDTLENRGGPRAADCARAALHGLLSWSLDKEFVDANVATGIKARAQNGSRERVLSEGELAEIWRACLDDDHGRITRLLVLSGQRKGEVGGLTWDEIDDAGRHICLPGARTKNGRAHTVALSNEAWALLPERRDGHEHLFGSLPGSGFSGWSKRKAELDTRIAASRKAAGEKAMDPWVLHDLRRTCATGLQKLGVRLEVTEAILNHVSGSRGGIVGIYQRHKFTDEARAALEAWGRRVAQIVR